MPEKKLILKYDEMNTQLENKLPRMDRVDKWKAEDVQISLMDTMTMLAESEKYYKAGQKILDKLNDAGV